MLVTGVLLTMNLSGAALAEDKQRGSRYVLEEVVVTAQKQPEDLQQVPIAVTAMSAEMIKAAGISDVSGIAARTPGFSMGTFNPTQPQLYIRGIGSNGDGAGGGEQSVAMFVDGIYMNRSAATGVELYDVQSIEVLRGPQGTLWGKNAIGGAISINTQKPAIEAATALELSTGNIGYSQLRGMLTGALSDRLSGKLSFNKKNRDGYIDSVMDSNVSTGDIDSSGVRAQFLYIPADNIEALLTLDYGQDKRSGGVAVPSSEQGLLGVYLQDPALPKAGFYQNYLDQPGQTDMASKGASLRLDIDTSIGTITSLTAYRYSDTAFNNISFGASIEAFPVLFIDNFAREESAMFSQELRISGATADWNWQTGVYISSEDTDRLEGADFATAIDLNALFNGAGIVPLGFVQDLPADSAAQSNKTQSTAIFGQTTYALNDRIDVTFGMRYTREHKDFGNLGTRGAGLFVLEDYDIATSKTWAAPTYRLAVAYQLTAGISSYASVATGFKSGGFDGLSSNSQVAVTPFNEEGAVNLELGLKAMLLSNRLRFNTAVFNTDYTDLQILQTFPNGTPIPPLQTKNAGKALSRGVELETTWIATERIQLSGHYAYLDTEYTQLDGSLAIYEGGKLRNAPRNSYGVVANYQIALSSSGRLNARAEYLHKDEAFQDVQNNSASAIPAYDVANFRLAYEAERGQWEIAGWIKNAFQEKYYSHNYGIAPFGTLHVPALPRTYGADLTIRF